MDPAVADFVLWLGGWSAPRCMPPPHMRPGLGGDARPRATDREPAAARSRQTWAASLNELNMMPSTVSTILSPGRETAMVVYLDSHSQYAFISATAYSRCEDVRASRRGVCRSSPDTTASFRR